MAQGFRTTADALVVTDVSVLIWNPFDTTGNFALEIWDATGTDGRPGAKVTEAGTGDAALFGTSSAIFTLSGLDLTLNPITAYFLVVKGISLTDIDVGMGMGPEPGYLAWSATPSTSGTGFPSNVSSWSGGWSSLDQSYPLQMSIEATTDAVPEPTALTLFGLVGLGLTRRRSAPA